MANKISICTQIALSLWGFVSLYVFASRNGSMELYYQLLESSNLADGAISSAISTGGRFPWLDTQHKQVLTFMWAILSQGAPTATRVVGIYHCLNWGAAWFLIVLEASRKGNKGLIITYLSVFGTIIFHQGHAVMTPLYLALYLWISPLSQHPSPEDLLIEEDTLKTLVPSFVWGFLLPLLFMCQPTNQIWTSTRKQTFIVWYQPWNLYVSAAQVILNGAISSSSAVKPRRSHVPRHNINKVYKTAFLFSAIPYWAVLAFVGGIKIWCKLFQTVQTDLGFKDILVLPSPLSDAKVVDFHEGVKWLLQWDILVGTAAMVAWTVTLYCKTKKGSALTAQAISKDVILYSMLGGPLGAAVIFMWKRDHEITSPQSEATLAEPPLASYTIPYFQHLLQFLNNPGRLFQSLKLKTGRTPFSLIMMNSKFHVFDSPEAVSTIFSKSRSFDFNPIVASLMENSLNLPTVDRKNFRFDHSSDHGKESFAELQRTLNIKYLSGNYLGRIMKVYEEKLTFEMKKAFANAQNDSWQEIDFVEVMGKLIVDTSIEAFFGPRLRQLWPSMWYDWKMMSAVSYKATRSNKFFYLQPKAFLARRRMLQAFESWVTSESVPENNEEEVWDEVWGYRMNYEREKLAKQFGFTARGSACVHAFFLFVMTKNVAAMVPWFLLCLVESDTLIRRYRAELQSCYSIDDQSLVAGNAFSLDMNLVKKNDFVRGVWNEALRLGSAGVAGRVVVKDSLLEGHQVCKGSVILLPSQLIHFDDHAFPNPSEFLPDRWIATTDSEEERLLLRARNSRLRAFGGGTGICSGRFVAEHETLLVASIMLQSFDLELVNGDEELCLDPRSFGIMSPVNKILMRVRMRGKGKAN